MTLGGFLLLVLAQTTVTAYPQPLPENPNPAAEVESFEPVRPAASSSPSLSLLKGSVDVELGVDPVWESAPKIDFAEHVFSARAHLLLGADVKVSERVRAVVEGRATMRVGAPRDFDRAKATFEAFPGDIFIDGYFPSADVRLGFQRIPLGANALGSPVDVLNPRDLREGLLRAEPEVSTLTVFALRAQGVLGKVSWLAAYVPFFEPHRFALWGQDFALLQPALGLVLPTRGVDETVEDTLTPRLLETKRPSAFAGDVALRVRSTGSVKVGASWVWVNEKTPAVEIDPELAALMAAQQAGRPVDAALALSVQSRLAAQEQLYSATYRRQHIFGVDTSFLAGPLQIDADVGYSPRQTFIDAQLRPLSKPVLTWVVSLARAEEGDLAYAAGYQGMAVFGTGASEQLLLIEPAYAVGAERTAWLHLFWTQLGYRPSEARWEILARALFEPIGRSVAVAPQVTFHPTERWKVWLAADLFFGSDFSPLGYFRRDSQVVAGARFDFL
ncbi:MAG: hypothetical protein K1X64_14000 [Myxococcaceae bacterium]|nr:hypothetical protein [Myxococcaceae bacterium]